MRYERDLVLTEKIKNYLDSAAGMKTGILIGLLSIFIYACSDSSSSGPAAVSHNNDKIELYPPDPEPDAPDADVTSIKSAKDAKKLSLGQSMSGTGAKAGPPLAATWVAQGPGPTQGGQVENISPNNEVVGAIHTVVAHPSNADILLIGGANGGIWRTTNATAASPTWSPRIDSFPGLSIGAMEMDPANANKVLAGIGRFSSFGRNGSERTGLLLSNDGGVNWTQINDPLLQGENISGVAARGNMLLAASNTTGTGGLFRSTDNGGSWNQITPASGLAAGRAFDLVGDPSNALRFYTAIASVGVYRSDDNGATWTNISNNDVSVGGLQQTITGGGNNNTEMAVGSNGRVYAAVIINGQLNYLGFSDDQGGSWTAMDLPQVTRGGVINNASNATPIVITSNNHRLRNGDRITVTGVTGNTAANGTFTITNFNPVNPNQFILNGSSGNGAYAGGGAWTHVDGVNPRVKPGGQGGIHFSIVVDPADDNTVYVGGDRQDSPFINSIGAADFSGNLWRGDTTVAPTGAVPSPQWEHLTHSNAIAAIPGGGTASGSSPHADSREMVFDANGNIIEVDDGGIYRRTSPANNTGDWTSIIGNLQVTEFHDVAYDSNSNIIIGGAQDTGTPQQLSTGSTTWTSVSTADGGDVVVDDSSAPGQSTRFSSFQNLGGFRRQVYNAANAFVSSTNVGLTSAGNPLTPQFVTPLALNVTDETRLIIGGGNSVYESADQGDNITEINGPGANRNAMAYGHVNNPDLIVVGSGARVFMRTTAGGSLTATSAAFATGAVVDVVLDPADENNIYAISTTNVYQSTDAGANWTDITGDLDEQAGNYRSLEYVSGVTYDRLLVGTNAGVFLTSTANLGTWYEVGTNLPNVPVWDLDYDVADDVLLAGTLGRGAWTLANVSLLNQPPVALCQDISVDADAMCKGYAVAADVNNGSFDPDGGPISLALAPPAPYELGANDVTLTATDSLGAEDSCPAVVTVVDVTPAVIDSISVTPDKLWPPNHKMVPVTVSVTVSDNCDPDPVCRITSISVDEDDNGKGDGNTDDDWIITGDLTAELRAERSGRHDGREYEITVECTDDANNTTSAEVEVEVEHDKGKK